MSQLRTKAGWARYYAIRAKRLEKIATELLVHEHCIRSSVSCKRVRAAAAYIFTAHAHPKRNGDVSVGFNTGGVSINWMTHAHALWPWRGGSKPKSRRRDLVRAAALLIAALDRMED